MPFLTAAAHDEHVEQMYRGDVEHLGYVADQTRLWAHAPESLSVLSYVLRRASDTAGLTVRQRALVVTTAASTLGDPYCSLAFGTRLAGLAGADTAGRVVAGDDSALSGTEGALVAWTRRVVRDPNGTTSADVDELRAAGFDDQQIFALTLFVALRVAYATVNDALGALPDAELVALAPAQVRNAVRSGRPAARAR